MKFHVCPHSKGDAQSIITFFRTRLQTTILCWFEIPGSLAILSCRDIGTEILILVSGVDGVSVDTIHLLYQIRHWQSPPGNSSGCVCGYSPVFWHPVPVLSIVLQILIIHFGFYQPFHQGTSLQGLPLSSSCHIANAIHLIVLGDNIQSESYLDLADFTADHLQTQLMYDELAVDVSQFIKLVSAKEESPSFSFLLCISRFVSPQEFHIDFDFILLSAGLLLSGLPASITGEWKNFIEISDAPPLSLIFTRNDPLSPVQLCSHSHVSPLTVVSRLRWLGPLSALPRPCHQRHCSGSGSSDVTTSASRARLILLPGPGPRSFLEQSPESDIAGFATPVSISWKMDH